MKKDLYFFLSYMSDDVSGLINKEFLYHKFYLNFIKLVIKDMAFFTEKKNNVGFFNLKDFLNIKLFCGGIDFKYLKRNVLHLFKLI
jgi:hypothetical protein